MTADSADLSYLPMARLRAMLAAGEEVRALAKAFLAGGGNPVAEALRGAGTFVAERHYPPGDVHDAASGAQFYYHAHRDAADEHGHFHTFVRRGDGVAHLVALSMDRWGEPRGLFTVNRWVTCDTWMPAATVLGLIDRFQLAPISPLHRWVAAMVTLFRPDIEDLVAARDIAIEARRLLRPEVDALEDRALEIAAERPIDVERQIRRVRRALSA